RVSIVAGNAKERARYGEIVDKAEGMRCVSQHPDAAHALQELPRVRPDVALVDLGVPEYSGIECVRQLRILWPSVLCLILTRRLDDDSIIDSLQAGAAGYLLKAQTERALPVLIRQVLREEVVFTPEIARRVLVYFRQHDARRQNSSMLSA